jgi:hypothetical protein
MNNLSRMVLAGWLALGPALALRMKRSFVRLGLPLALLLALPFRAPAPIIYRPTEGWAYEMPGKKEDSRELRSSEPASTNADTDCLSFRDGDVLYGKLLALQPGAVLRWQHPDVSQPIDFKPEKVAQLDFAPRASTAPRADSSCKLWLANGDMLEGNVAACDHDALSLETWYAGPLKIPRRALQTLAFTPSTPVIFDGLTGLDGWTQGVSGKIFVGEAGFWSYRNGAFYSDTSSSVARDVKLPDRSQMQFDLTWKGQLNLAIALYTDSLQPISLTDKENGPDFGGFYSLRFQNTLVSLEPIRKQDPRHSLGDVSLVQSFQQKDRVHVDVRMSKADHRVALYLDGTLIKDWVDPGGFAGEGTGVRFVNNWVGGALKLSNLRVAQWNGVLNQASAEQPDPLHDVVLLESGAKVSGAVVSIAAGQISLLTTGGATNVPLAGVGAIEFARFQGQAPPPAAVNAHATFVQGGSVTFELLAWKPEGVAVLSPDFGQATFDPAAFRHLQFLAPEPK